MSEGTQSSLEAKKDSRAFPEWGIEHVNRSTVVASNVLGEIASKFQDPGMVRHQSVTKGPAAGTALQHPLWSLVGKVPAGLPARTPDLSLPFPQHCTDRSGHKTMWFVSKPTKPPTLSTAEPRAFLSQGYLILRDPQMLPPLGRTHFTPEPVLLTLKSKPRSVHTLGKFSASLSGLKLRRRA